MGRRLRFFGGSEVGFFARFARGRPGFRVGDRNDAGVVVIFNEESLIDFFCC